MNVEFQIFSCHRQRLSKGKRIYQVVFGLLLSGWCLPRFDWKWIPLIVVGLFLVGYG